MSAYTETTCYYETTDMKNNYAHDGAMNEPADLFNKMKGKNSKRIL